MMEHGLGKLGQGMMCSDLIIASTILHVFNSLLLKSSFIWCPLPFTFYPFACFRLSTNASSDSPVSGSKVLQR